MRAYKFLGRGAVGTFTGFAWPAPGTWIDVGGALDPCRNGLHVCRPEQLAHWVQEELWELDVDGDQIDGIDCIVVRRARLVRRVAAWDASGAERFARACIAHAEPIAGTDALADARDAVEHGYPAIAAYVAALAVARASGDVERAYADERAWQSSWIGRELL